MSDSMRRARAAKSFLAEMQRRGVERLDDPALAYHLALLLRPEGHPAVSATASVSEDSLASVALQILRIVDSPTARYLATDDDVFVRLRAALDRDPMIEIECKRCHAKHHPRVLGRSLTCCSRHDGVTRLVAEYHDPITDRRWFTVSSQAIVRVLT